MWSPNISRCSGFYGSLNTPWSDWLFKSTETSSFSLLHAIPSSSQPGAAETSNGKRKIRNEKQDKFQMAVKKKKLPLGHKSASCSRNLYFQSCRFFSMKMTKYLFRNNSFFLPVRKYCSLSFHLFFLLRPLWRRRRTIRTLKKKKSSWFLYPSSPFLHLNKKEHDTVRQCY